MGVSLRKGYEEWINTSKRQGSPELDFGVHWSLSRGGYDLKFRVSWIQETGELYATALYPERDLYVILGQFSTEKEVEEAMKGWEELMWKKNSLSLLARRFGVLLVPLSFS